MSHLRTAGGDIRSPAQISRKENYISSVAIGSKRHSINRDEFYTTSKYKNESDFWFACRYPAATTP